jgi:hypothetical protein
MVISRIIATPWVCASVPKECLCARRYRQKAAWLQIQPPRNSTYFEFHAFRENRTFLRVLEQAGKKPTQHTSNPSNVFTQRGDANDNLSQLDYGVAIPSTCEGIVFQKCRLEMYGFSRAPLSVPLRRIPFADLAAKFVPVCFFSVVFIFYPSKRRRIFTLSMAKSLHSYDDNRYVVIGGSIGYAIMLSNIFLILHKEVAMRKILFTTVSAVAITIVLTGAALAKGGVSGHGNNNAAGHVGGAAGNPNSGRGSVNSGHTGEANNPNNKNANEAAKEAAKEAAEGPQEAAQEAAEKASGAHQ